MHPSFLEFEIPMWNLSSRELLETILQKKFGQLFVKRNQLFALFQLLIIEGLNFTMEAIPYI